MFFNLVCIFVLLFIVMFINKIYFNKTENLRLFPDNGNRIKLNVDTTLFDKIQKRKKVPCNVRSLTKCKVNEQFECFNCHELLAACIHFEKDERVHDVNNKETGAIVVANKNKQEGYCLRLTDRGRRTCTIQNGGRWILVEHDGKYSYICACTSPQLFSNYTMYGDCTRFHGCRNGKISNKSWKLLSQIECDCNNNYFFISVNGAPQCERKNAFNRDETTFHKLDKKYINPEYPGINLKLPNPCTFDTQTGRDYALGVATIQLYKGVAFCVAQSPLYTTVMFEDDYLIGNGGKYANAVVKISTQPNVEGAVLETHTLLKDSKKFYDTPFIGRRFKYSTFLFKLPYLERTSFNVSGSGPNFTYAEYMKLSEYDNALVCVWNAPVPNPKPFIFGNVISYVPTYVSVVSAHYKDFVGTVPSVGVPRLDCNSFHITTLLKTLFYKYPHFQQSANYEKNPVYDAPEKTHLYVMPILCKRDGKTDVQIYSKIFTGLLLTFHYRNQIYTKPINPGKLLVRLYRLTLDSEWTDFKKHFRSVNVYEPFSIVPSTYTFMAGETNHSIDNEETALPPKEQAHYKIIDTKQIEWAKNY